tara:strand:- start:326 stop:535 length:210 start_codon:yes stop_codon:yes gene_type:complete
MQPNALRKSFEVLHQRVTAIIYYCGRTYSEDAELMRIIRDIVGPLDDLYSHYWELDLEMLPKDKDKIIN